MQSSDATSVDSTGPADRGATPKNRKQKAASGNQKSKGSAQDESEQSPVRRRRAPSGSIPVEGVKPAPARFEENLAVRGLNLIIEDATLKEMPFDEFTEWLGRTTEANVVVRWKTLEAVGIERDFPLNIEARNIRLRDLIARVFERLTDERPSAVLALKADGNTLWISTRQDINTSLVTRVYDVQDLLVAAPNFLGMDNLGDNAERGARLAGGDRNRESKESADQPAAELVQVIMAHVQPRSWKAAGGRGTIVIHRGRLIIYNNLEVHQTIAGAIRQVREVARENR
ncbi:MAG: hypothetical protein KF841_13345 [Phycisphaerae bacterium]|nr:hypothetical protein [Phycisphaerae bacterium]